tara:strand:+ start:180 stop:911 length:732 start_codon:yes stop_codon:yes gene_type:complete
MDLKKLNIEGFDLKDLLGNGNKVLLVVLGVFGDFDSFEYAQALRPNLKLIFEKGIKLKIIGIGTPETKKNFSEYTKIPLKYIQNIHDSELHNQLSLKDFSGFSQNNFLNLLLMCAGVGSPGTIREVLRGYFGDKNAKNIFSNEDKIILCRHINFNGSLFEAVGPPNYLRPFELATRRLMNMIEVFSNWNLYIKSNKYLTQRGATFFIDEEGEIIYEYKSKALLGYSDNMSKPLAFLDNNITLK